MKKEILNLIMDDARMSVCDLAAALQESESNILNTLSELEKEKIICGYHTIINWDKTNIDYVSALIQVDVCPEEEYGYDRIAKRIYKYDEVTNMYLMSGKCEFAVFVAGKTMQDIANFVATKLACIDQVTGTSTYFVLKQYKVEGVIIEEEKDNKERMIISA